MGLPGIIHAQTGGRQFHQPGITKYSGFVGGVNATHHALRNYSPLMHSFSRLFMVRPPKAIAKMFAGSDANLYSPESLFVQFKHMLEYMHRSITGFADKNLENASTTIQGGFAGRQFNTPTVTREATNQIVISLYEFQGSPVYTVIDGWMNAIGDENSGLATYGGWVSGGRDENLIERRLFIRPDETSFGIPFNEANHTAEFIYVMHDRTGAQVERAVLLADCYPKGIAQGQVLDMQPAGAHDNVTYDITFNCVVYRSPIITAIANDLLKQYRIVSNSLNFNPELGDAVYAPDGEPRQSGNYEGNNSLMSFNPALGLVPVDSATGTNIGNYPAFYEANNAHTTVHPAVSMDDGRLSRQPNNYPTPSNDGFHGHTMMDNRNSDGMTEATARRFASPENALPPGYVNPNAPNVIM
jgi:hypothetical protein